MPNEQPPAKIREIALALDNAIENKNITAILSSFTNNCEIELLRQQLTGKEGVQKWIDWLYHNFRQIKFQPVIIMVEGNTLFEEFIVQLLVPEDFIRVSVPEPAVRVSIPVKVNKFDPRYPALFPVIVQLLVPSVFIKVSLEALPVTVLVVVGVLSNLKVIFFEEPVRVLAPPPAVIWSI